MSNTPQPQPKPIRLPPALIGVGILVIALGFGLPMLTSGSLPGNPPHAATKDVPAAKDAPAAGPTAAGTPAPIQPPAATNLGASLLRLAVGLAVVCGLCILVARWIGQKQPTTPGTMEVLASLTVARCVIHLVRAGDRRLLIGTDLAGVKAILELPGPAPELPPAPPLSISTSAAPLDEALMPLVPTSTPLTPPDATSPPTQEAIVALLARLRARTDASSPG